MNTRDLQCNLDNRLQLLRDISVLSTKLQTLGDSHGCELSWKQSTLILLLHSCEFIPTLGELSHQMGSSHQNTKAMLQKLEEKGYVSLISDVNDRRRTLIYTTDLSHAFYLGYEEKYRAYLEKIFEDFEDGELLKFSSFIEMMTKKVEENQ